MPCLSLVFLGFIPEKGPGTSTRAREFLPLVAALCSSIGPKIWGFNFWMSPYLMHQLAPSLPKSAARGIG